MSFRLPGALSRRPIRREDVHGTVHGRGAYGRFNTRLAVRITNAVGTMTCAWIFALIALLALPQAIHDTLSTGSPMPVVQWIAQTFCQLVLLSVILVGQNVQGAYAEKRARDDHEIHAANHEALQAILQRLPEKPEPPQEASST